MVSVVTSLKTFSSALPLIAHSSNIFYYHLQDIFEYTTDSDNTADDFFLCNIDNDAPQLFNQSENPDLISCRSCPRDILKFQAPD